MVWRRGGGSPPVRVRGLQLPGMQAGRAARGCAGAGRRGPDRRQRHGVDGDGGHQQRQPDRGLRIWLGEAFEEHLPALAEPFEEHRHQRQEQD